MIKGKLWMLRLKFLASVFCKKNEGVTITSRNTGKSVCFYITKWMNDYESNDSEL